MEKPADRRLTAAPGPRQQQNQHPTTAGPASAKINGGSGLTQGVRQLEGLRKDHRLPWSVVLGHVLLALVLYAATFAFLLGAAAAGRDWPIPRMQETLGAVSMVSALGAVPWLAVVWLTHRVLQEQRPPSQDDTQHRIDEHTSVQLNLLGKDDAGRLRAELLARRIADFPLTRLTRLWDMIEACTRAFAVFVVIALVPTGALRLAWLAQGVLPEEARPRSGKARLEYESCPAPEQAETELKEACEALTADFPTLQVLLYGAFFAVLLVAVALPLLVSWRARARAVLDDAAPQGTIAQLEDAALGDRRNRLETALRLDSGLLREPVSAIAILTPLGSSLVAALLPELVA